MLPRYHSCTLEKPLNKRFFAYKVLFRRAGTGKTKKCGVNAAKINFWVYRQTEKFAGLPQHLLQNLYFLVVRNVSSTIIIIKIKKISRKTGIIAKPAELPIIPNSGGITVEPT